MLCGDINGKEIKEGIRICTADSLGCTAETNRAFSTAFSCTQLKLNWKKEEEAGDANRFGFSPPCRGVSSPEEGVPGDRDAPTLSGGVFLGVPSPPPSTYLCLLKRDPTGRLSLQMPVIPWLMLSLIKTFTLMAFSPITLRNGRSVRGYFLVSGDIRMKSPSHHFNTGSYRLPGAALARPHNWPAVPSVI